MLLTIEEVISNLNQAATASPESGPMVPKRAKNHLYYHVNGLWNRVLIGIDDTDALTKTVLPVTKAPNRIPNIGYLYIKPLETWVKVLDTDLLKGQVRVFPSLWVNLIPRENISNVEPSPDQSSTDATAPAKPKRGRKRKPVAEPVAEPADTPTSGSESSDQAAWLADALRADELVAQQASTLQNTLDSQAD